MIRRFLLSGFALIFTFIISGCLDADDVITVNPDGTGKVVITANAKQIEFGPKKSAKAQVSDFLSTVIGHSSGIDAWKDVTCKVLPDGHIAFTGTAYFHDADAFDIKTVMLLHMHAERTGQTLKILFGTPTDDDTTTTEPVKLTEQEIRTRIDSLKQNFATTMPMISGLIGTMSERTTINVGGEITSAEGFIRKGPNAVAINFSGKHALHLLDSLTALPNYWREEVLAEASGTRKERDRQMRAILFGVDQPTIMVHATGAPLFNYTAEVAGARAAMPAMLKKYGVKLHANEN